MNVQTTATSARVASASASRLESLCARRTRTTLLELVWVVGEITPDDDEVVASVLHMLQSGAVRLLGADS